MDPSNFTGVPHFEPPVDTDLRETNLQPLWQLHEDEVVTHQQPRSYELHQHSGSSFSNTNMRYPRQSIISTMPPSRLPPPLTSSEYRQRETRQRHQITTTAFSMMSMTSPADSIVGSRSTMSRAAQMSTSEAPVEQALGAGSAMASSYVVPTKASNEGAYPGFPGPQHSRPPATSSWPHPPQASQSGPYGSQQMGLLHDAYTLPTSTPRVDAPQPYSTQASQSLPRGSWQQYPFPSRYSPHYAYLPQMDYSQSHPYPTWHINTPRIEYLEHGYRHAPGVYGIFGSYQTQDGPRDQFTNIAPGNDRPQHDIMHRQAHTEGGFAPGFPSPFPQYGDQHSAAYAAQQPYMFNGSQTQPLMPNQPVSRIARANNSPKRPDIELHGLFGNPAETTPVRGSLEAISELQGLLTRDKLLVARNADKSIPDALKVSLDNMTKLEKMTACNQLWDEMEDALNPDILLDEGLSLGEIHHINKCLPDDAGKPTFQGRRDRFNHASYAFRVCKSLSRKHECQNDGYNLLVTTERIGKSVQVQLFPAANKPSYTIGLHRSFRPDGSESWKPYRLPAEKAAQELPANIYEEAHDFEAMLAAESSGIYDISTQNTLPSFGLDSMLPQMHSPMGQFTGALPPLTHAPQTTASRKIKSIGCFRTHSKNGKRFFQPPAMPRIGHPRANEFNTPPEVMGALRRGEVTNVELCAELALLVALGYPNKECGAPVNLDENSFCKGRFVPALKARAKSLGVDFKTYKPHFLRERIVYRAKLAREEAARAASETPLASAATQLASASTTQ